MKERGGDIDTHGFAILDQLRGRFPHVESFLMDRATHVGGAGGQQISPGARLLDAPDFPDWVKPGSLATVNALEQLRQEPSLEWSFLAPSAEMKPGERTGKFRLGGDQLLVDAKGKSHISVQDYAVAMIDELERPVHMRQRFTVGY